MIYHKMVNFIWKNTYHIYPIISTDISRKKIHERPVHTAFKWRTQTCNYMSIYQMNLAQSQRVVIQNMLSSLINDESFNIPVNISGYRILYIDWIPKLDTDLHVHPNIQRMVSFILTQRSPMPRLFNILLMKKKPKIGKCF